MGRSTLKVKGYTPDQIKALFKKNERYSIGIRLYAVYQVSLGKSSRQLEEFYNTSFKQITNWVHRFEREGIDGLRDKPGRGRKPKLNQDQLHRLKEVVRDSSPLDFGYNSATWTGPLLIDWIKTTFKVEYKKAQIYNLLKKLGFSYQKSKGIYPEADKQQQAAFKEELKKTSDSSAGNRLAL